VIGGVLFVLFGGQCAYVYWIAVTDEYISFPLWLVVNLITPATGVFLIWSGWGPVRDLGVRWCGRFIVIAGVLWVLFSVSGLVGVLGMGGMTGFGLWIGFIQSMLRTVILPVLLLIDLGGPILDWGLLILAVGVLVAAVAWWRRHRVEGSSPPEEEPETDRDAPSTGGDSENGGAGS